MNIEKDDNCRNEEQTKSDIEKHGLTVIIIEGTDYLPAFAYSIGLWQRFEHPEIICFGLTTKTLHALINNVADIVKEGKTIATNIDFYDIFESTRAQFLKVDHRNIGDYFGTAINFYETSDFPTIQLVWTDRNDKFPWEDGFEEEFTYRQPLLDRNADFKFREAKNLAVFTTRQWLELSRPILRVVHENNGDWQFLTGDQIQEDAKLVSLEKMTLRDETLNQVFDLDYGEEAEREFIGDSWTRNKVEYDEE